MSPSGIRVLRGGRITRNGETLGWADQYQQGSKWRGIKEGGRTQAGFRTRAEAAAWVVAP